MCWRNIASIILLLLLCNSHLQPITALIIALIRWRNGLGCCCLAAISKRSSLHSRGLLVGRSVWADVGSFFVLEPLQRGGFYGNSRIRVCVCVLSSSVVDDQLNSGLDFRTHRKYLDKSGVSSLVCASECVCVLHSPPHRGGVCQPPPPPSSVFHPHPRSRHRSFVLVQSVDRGFRRHCRRQQQQQQESAISSNTIVLPLPSSYPMRLMNWIWNPV